MSETEDIVLKKFKEQLAQNDEISSELIKALIAELESENSNAEKLAGIIELRKEHLGD